MQPHMNIPHLTFFVPVQSHSPLYQTANIPLIHVYVLLLFIYSCSLTISLTPFLLLFSKYTYTYLSYKWPLQTLCYQVQQLRWALFIILSLHLFVLTFTLYLVCILQVNNKCNDTEFCIWTVFCFHVINKNRPSSWDSE